MDGFFVGMHAVGVGQHVSVEGGVFVAGFVELFHFFVGLEGWDATAGTNCWGIEIVIVEVEIIV